MGGNRILVRVKMGVISGLLRAKLGESRGFLRRRRGKEWVIKW